MKLSSHKGLFYTTVLCLLPAFFISGLVIDGNGHNGIIISVEHILASISHAGVSGELLVIVLFVIIAFTGVLPASFIGVAAGSLYGPVLGFAIAGISILAGALAAFGVCRTVFRQYYEELLERHLRFRSFDGGMARSGYRGVCLLRLSPVMPYALTSFALGLSSIRWQAYLVGTLAALPALFAYVCIGWITRNGVATAIHGAGYIRWAVWGAGVVATAGLFLFFRRLTTRLAASSGDAADH